MSVNNQPFLCVLLLSMSLFACNKDETTARTIQEEWIWTSSVGGWSGSDLLTPESEGFIQSLIIDTDFYTEFIDDSLVSEQTYEFGISEEPIYAPDIYTYINLEFGTKYTVEINEDRLTLFPLTCADCFRHHYNRR